MKLKSQLILSLIAGCATIAAGTAHAGVSINLGNTAAPTFVAPAPATEATPGWHGDRYHDDHRMGDRKDWEAHQRMAQDHREVRHDERHDERARHDADHRDDHGAFHHQG
ncbi:hypothetical protein [Paraburkholderia sp. J11-2]|uniref:hypothetical protein n=1 Tax=Paraburkholderia sp. J11-2 TaxID=2805431 RepID=UPI002AB7DCCD|nr:hypothetical protein [Paraburkholderia sp. J11-2]